MFTAYEGHSRFALALIVTGALMIVLGAIALLWGSDTLVNAMMGASLLLAALGFYKIILGIRARRLSRGWPVPVADGVASIALAALSVTLTATPSP